MCFFFFNDTATTEIYTLSLHDALPISIGGAWRPTYPPRRRQPREGVRPPRPARATNGRGAAPNIHRRSAWRSEEHTSELPSRPYLVCRLLLEKKKKTSKATDNTLL